MIEHIHRADPKQFAENRRFGVITAGIGFLTAVAVACSGWASGCGSKQQDASSVHVSQDPPPNPIPLLPPSPKAKPVVEPPKQQPITPEEAINEVGKYCVVQMRVLSSRRSSSGKTFFLNSRASYQSPRNFTVMLGENALGELAKSKATPDARFRGKLVRVSGVVRSYKDRPEIVVESLDQIEVVSE